MTPENTDLERLLQERPGSVAELTERMTPDIYRELQTAVELRKFSDGTRLTPEQVENCLQLVILYEAKYLPESARTGYDIPASCKSQQNTGMRAGGDGVQIWSKESQ